MKGRPGVRLTERNGVSSVSGKRRKHRKKDKVGCCQISVSIDLDLTFISPSPCRIIAGCMIKSAQHACADEYDMMERNAKQKQR
jgi:hypothetical protein